MRKASAIKHRFFVSIWILFSLLLLSSFSAKHGGVNQKETVKIGLLLTSDTAQDPLCKQAANAIMLSIRHANQSGGINGKKIELFIRSCDGNWGAGSKQAVSLIFDQGVHALIGFVDGRTAHLIEQVCTKAQIPFMSTLSPDPTLSKINIPWFFSSIPDADQQSEVLVKAIFQDQKLKKMSVIQSNDYDANQFKKAFFKQVDKDRYPVPTSKIYQSENINFMLDSLANAGPEGVIFFGDSKEAQHFLSTCTSLDMDLPLYFPIIELDEHFANPTALSIYQLMPASLNRDHFNAFKNNFFQAFDYSPGINSAFAYDGTQAILEAIKKKGASPDAIREGLLELQLEGITGVISFHSSGKRQGNLEMTEFGKKHYEP